MWTPTDRLGTTARRAGAATLAVLAMMALATVLLSCRKQSPDDALLKSAEPVASWLATLRMTSEK